MKRTTEGEALTSLILETFRFNGALLACGNQLAKPFGLTSARWQVMGPISKEKLTVAQIARRMGLARQGVQRIVNDLIKLELVALEPNLDHKRASLVVLTKAGEEVMEGIYKVQAGWVNGLAKDLTEEEILKALKLIESVREQIE